MATTTPFKQVIDAANSGERFPVMDLVRIDPALAATIAKLVPPVEPAHFGHDGNRTPNPPNMGEFKTLLDRKAQDVTDAQTVMQVLPEMELAAQILISSILAPKDMMTTELTYSVPEGRLPPDVAAAMIAKVKEHFEQVYRIKPLLAQILRDMLFDTGSYPVAVIPENSVDEAINGPSRISMESLSAVVNTDGTVRGLGLLGPAVARKPSLESTSVRLSLESFHQAVQVSGVENNVTFEGQLDKAVADSFVSVTDNYNVLKVPRLQARLREEKILDVIGSPAMEAINPRQNQRTRHRLNDRELQGLMYKERQYGFKPIAQLKTQEELARNTVGNPLVLHLPSEAVIPVYVPGTPEQHIGYFVMLDTDGNPIQKQATANHYEDLANRMNSNGSFPSAMLSKVRGQMNGFDLRNPAHMDSTVRLYGNMVEQDLLSRLRNGVYGNGVALAKREEVYRIMLARALAKQHTQLLFVPIELMTYMALRFDEHGMGKSLLDDMKIINSLRSMLLFANVMASLKNSIGRTKVDIKLDEADPDPNKTVEITMHEIIRSRQQAFPLGMNSPTDLTDWIQRAAFEFTHKGHPGLPDVDIEFSEKNSSYVKPDTELEESLRKRSLMAMGLNPETVDNGFHAEFATTVVAQNLLLAKRVAQYQEQLEPLLNDHHHKVAMNSQELMEALRAILEENASKLKLDKSDQREATQAAMQKSGEANTDLKQELLIQQTLREFVMSFEVTLPRPNTVTIKNQTESLKEYIEALDLMLDSYVSTDLLTSEFGGDAAQYADSLKKVVRAYFIRQWASENGMLHELSQLTTQDEDGKAMIDFATLQESHLKGLMKSVGTMLKDLKTAREASDKTIQDTGAPAGSGSSGGFGSTDTGSEGAGAGGGDFDLGSGEAPDMGAGLNLDEGTGGSDTSTNATDTSTEPTEGGTQAAGSEQPAEGSEANKPAADDKAAEAGKGEDEQKS